MLLFDRCVQQGKVGVINFAARDKETSIVPISVNNVARYYYEDTDKEIWDAVDDFPNIAPPFKTCFIEFPFPLIINTKAAGVLKCSDIAGRGTHAVMKQVTCGVLLTAFDLRDTADREAFARVAEHWSVVVEDATPTDARWAMVALYFSGSSAALTMHPLGHIWFVDQDGRMAGQNRVKRFIIIFFEGWETTGLPQTEDSTTVFVGWMHTALLTLCFMNCKNVQLERVTPPPKLAAAHLKRTGTVLHEYHVVNIGPMTKTLAATAIKHGVGRSKALHICRGHFKHFTGAGLFGRVKGTYWWGMHVRGDAERGAVKQQYTVTPRPLEANR